MSTILPLAGGMGRSLGFSSSSAVPLRSASMSSSTSSSGLKSAAWYEDLTSGPLATWRNPLSRAICFSSSKYSGLM